MLNFTEHKNKKLAELTSDKIAISNLSDALDILANAHYNGAELLITKKENFNSDFYELKTKLAGEILQKFTNYKMKLIIIGNFTNIESKSLRDFIYECNKGGKIIFADNKNAALKLAIA